MSFQRKHGELIFSTVMVMAAALTWTQRQAIYDWSRLHNYHPPAAITQLAVDTALNSKAKNLFYVQHPELDDKATFNSHCLGDEQTIILGCYISKRGIYILDVQDIRLAGIEQVTSAHELLHAAYDRLSAKDRSVVNKLINDTYAKITDQRIRTTIEDYRKDGADVANELHSILGTEVRSLPEELETYYKRYFVDRLKVVSFSEKYVQVFTEEQDKTKALLAQIESLEKELFAERAKIESQDKSLQTESARLDSLKQQGRIDEYNKGAKVYNSNLDKFRRDLNAYNAKVASYKALIDEYNNHAQKQRELNQAINSRVNTQESK